MSDKTLSPITCDLSIVIVNWNTCSLLAQCLSSLEADTSLALVGKNAKSVAGITPLVEVIVVDNASTDESVSMVRTSFPWVQLLVSAENLGFAAGNNLAFSGVQGDYVLLLNPDTTVVRGAITLLWQVLRAYPMAGIAGAQLLNADGSLQASIGVYPSLQSEIPLLNRLRRPVHKSFSVAITNQAVAVRAVDWVSGACLMIRRSAMEMIGPLDENFWLYTEETDWCFRAQAHGWEVLFVPQAQVYHLARAASRQRFIITTLHFYQSRVRFVCKHSGHYQANWMRYVLRAKIKVWSLWLINSSPLSQAYPDLSKTEMIQTYLALSQALAVSLEEFLATNWQEKKPRQLSV